jgi:hypothetical protein
MPRGNRHERGIAAAAVSMTFIASHRRMVLTGEIVFATAYP